MANPLPAERTSFLTGLGRYKAQLERERAKYGGVPVPRVDFAVPMDNGTVWIPAMLNGRDVDWWIWDVNEPLQGPPIREGRALSFAETPLKRFDARLVPPEKRRPRSPPPVAPPPAPLDQEPPQ